MIITFKPTKGALGHLTKSPVWVSNHADAKYELNISAYTIDRSPEEICETILHEQVHLYCNLYNINECSNMGRNHNSRFKKIAESHGLICQKVSYWGWAITSLDDDANKYVKKLKVKQFAYRYNGGTRSSGRLMRYQCPACRQTVAWLSSPQSLLCGTCHVPLEYAPTKHPK